MRLFLPDKYTPRQPKYTWRLDRNITHESFWSIVHRFCALNAISGSDFLELFTPPEKKNHQSISRLMIIDLREIHHLNKKLLYDVFGADLVEPSLPSEYVFPLSSKLQIEGSTPCSYLRYCEPCMKTAGIHMAFNQFTCVKVCPVHGSTIIDRCPNCNERMRFQTPSHKGPHKCTCGFEYWSPSKASDWRAPPSLVKELIKWGNWFSDAFKNHCNRTHKHWCSPLVSPIIALTKDTTASLWCQESGLITMWAILSPQRNPFNHNHTGELTPYTQSHFIALGTSKNDLKKRQCSPIYPEARSIYKSICRNFYRRVLKKHKRSIRLISQNPNNFPNGDTIGIILHPGFDPIAHVFVLWKCYWETRHADEIFSSERREITWKWARSNHEQYDNHSPWEQGAIFNLAREVTSLDEQLQNHYVGRKCIATFEEIMTYVSEGQMLSVDTFIPADKIDQRYVPIMEVDHLNDASTYLTCFLPRMRWLHSDIFEQWVKSVPLKTQFDNYCRIIAQSNA
jgi:hypothetical protein